MSNKKKVSKKQKIIIAFIIAIILIIIGTVAYDDPEKNPEANGEKAAMATPTVECVVDVIS